MRWILAGGGTGGHLFPGLAVAGEVKRKNGTAEILFIGSERGIENRVLPRGEFGLETLPIQGIQGRGLRGIFQALWGVPKSLCRSLRIIERFQPELILGLGGYASGPVILAGKWKRIRCAIMEQNLRPGLTNRILGWMVDRIFTSYPETALYFKAHKVLLTGNPVRWERLPEIPRDEKFTVLVFGGSAGAHRLNACMTEALAKMVDLGPKVRFLHQTGDADFAVVQAAYRSLPFEAEIVPFIEKMDEAYARADLVVCRAGATTIAELTAFGKASILIPYPYAANDHQRRNAQALVERGAAAMILDRDLGAEKLAGLIRGFYEEPGPLNRMAEMAKKLGRPEAAKRIVESCLALVQGTEAVGAA